MIDHTALKAFIDADADGLGFAGKTAAQIRALGDAVAATAAHEPTKKEVLQALKAESGGATRYAAFQVQGQIAAGAVLGGSPTADQSSLYGFWKQWEEWPLDEPMDVNDSAFQGGWDAMVDAGLFLASDKAAVVALGSTQKSYWTANGFGGVRDRDFNIVEAM